MNKNNLPKSLFAALLIASPLAGAEPQYPANVEPVILYQDTDYIAKNKQSATPSAPSQAASQAKKPTASAEPAKREAVATKPEPTPAQQEKSSMENYPIVLVILALAGIVFWTTRRSKAKAQPAPAEAAVFSSGSAGASGETGVARYLKSLPAKLASSETGVARYLKSLPEKVTAAETGVAKYLKSLPAKVSSAETGVARYLKNQDLSAK
ncbi:MAG: hypothetical protein PHE55_20995 [Methylococcaceae bacterium]|nr:hypothetical protein [Methylococcaceae bacterium]